MGIFDALFSKKEKELPESERKWNLMWDLWAEGLAPSPYAELMEYESEVNNGGHDQYFFNVSNCGDLAEAVERVLSVLPEPLRGNLQRGYEAFAAQEDEDDDENEELFEECDDLFYEQEELLIRVLQQFADTLEG